MKFCLCHPDFRPSLALLDPELTVGLPHHLTAWTGADALTHAIEAYLVPGFHPLCDGMALEGLALINRWLPLAVREPDNLAARGGMLVGSCLAGIAFIKGLGLVHAISHMVGAEFDTQHGPTNAIVLPVVLRFNLPGMDHKTKRMAEAMGLTDHSPAAFIREIECILDEIGIPHSLAEINVPEDCAERISHKALEDSAAATNPRGNRRRGKGADRGSDQQGALDRVKPEQGEDQMENLQKFYINGEWVDPLSDATMAVLNPATEQQIGTVALGNAADVDRAVAAANAAFEGFSKTSREERLALLKKVKAITEARFEDLAQAMRMEMGAPITMSREAQADAAIGHLDGFIAALEELAERQTLANGDIMIREAIGVCGLITPWNWPMNQITLKVLPALATGCCCVLKPSEHTPVSAMIYTEILHEAGYPAGVFNLVNGEGPVVGAALSRHPDIQMMSFTGSTRQEQPSPATLQILSSA